MFVSGRLAEQRLLSLRRGLGQCGSVRLPVIALGVLVLGCTRERFFFASLFVGFEEAGEDFVAELVGAAEMPGEPPAAASRGVLVARNEGAD